MIWRRTLTMLALATALWLVADVVLACPTCKDQLAHDQAAANIVRGYFWSILFMLSMPFLILTGLGSYFYYEVCKARARMATEALAAGGVVQPAVEFPQDGRYTHGLVEAG